MFIMLMSRRSTLMRRLFSSLTSFNRGHINSRKTTEQERSEALKKMVLNPIIQSTLEVSRMKNMILENSDIFSPENIDRSIIMYLTKNQQFRMALDYIDFLDEETKVKLHLFLIKQQFFIYFRKRYADGSLPPSEQKLIIQLYKNLRKASNVLNSHLLENAILALSVTSEWEHCLELLTELQKLDSPSNICYSAVVAGAFLNGKDEIAWTLLNEMFAKQRFPNDVVFKAYLENLKELSDKKLIILQLDKLLQEYSEKNFILTENSIQDLCQFLKKSGLHYRLTSVNKKGYCENCKEKLYLCELGDEAFENLRRKIVDSIIVGKNIFNKTSPAEFDRFKEFLKSLRDCNVVIDGLNVAYIAGTKQTPEVFSTFLARVVAHFVERRRKIIVFGRKHMESWPKEQWNYIRNNAELFLTQNISLDDPYLLYCAVHCGKNAILVSRDLMRSHLFLLSDPKDKLLFSRWLEQRQFQVTHVRNDGKIFFKAPYPYSRTVQHNGNCLHIPYDTPENEAKGRNGYADNWLCLKKPEGSKKVK